MPYSQFEEIYSLVIVGNSFSLESPPVDDNVAKSFMSVSINVD